MVFVCRNFTLAEEASLDVASFGNIDKINPLRKLILFNAFFYPVLEHSAHAQKLVQGARVHQWLMLAIEDTVKYGDKVAGNGGKMGCHIWFSF